MDGTACISKSIPHNDVHRTIVRWYDRIGKSEIGASGPLFTNSFDFYGHLLTKTWIKGVWNEIWENKLTVKEKTMSLFLKQDNYVFLNETFLSKGYSKKKLHILNTC